jgi:hypothetical protein
MSTTIRLVAGAVKKMGSNCAVVLPIDWPVKTP